MNKKWIIITFFAVFVALFEVSFLSFLPSPWQEWHPLLEAVVLWVLLDRPHPALFFAGVAGVTISLYRIEPSFFLAIQYLWIAAIVSLIQETVLTNRSLYAALSLMFVARIAEGLFTNVAYALQAFFSQNIYHIKFSWISSLGVFIWDMGVMTTVFIVLALFTRHFMINVLKTQNFYDNT